MLTDFGRELRRIRIERGQLLMDMAIQLGMGAAELSSIEMGRKPIPPEMLGWLEEYCGIGGRDWEALALATRDPVLERYVAELKRERDAMWEDETDATTNAIPLRRIHALCVLPPDWSLAHLHGNDYRLEVPEGVRVEVARRREDVTNG